MSADRIEREITVAAPVERVWAVLTRPEHVGQWFGQGQPVRVDLRPGGVMELDHGKYGSYPTRIVRVDPPRFFSYRWASAFPGQETTDDNSTLVEFTLTPEGDATRLRMVESGFTRLEIPEERLPYASHESHSEGWTEVLDMMRKYAEQQSA